MRRRLGAASDTRPVRVEAIAAYEVALAAARVRVFDETGMQIGGDLETNWAGRLTFDGAAERAEQRIVVDGSQ